MCTMFSSVRIATTVKLGPGATTFIANLSLKGQNNIHLVSWLKEYYEIVDEARPLSGFFTTHADLFTEIHF